MWLKKNVMLNIIIKIFAVITVEGLKVKSLGKREFARLREGYWLPGAMKKQVVKNYIRP